MTLCKLNRIISFSIDHMNSFIKVDFSIKSHFLRVNPMRTMTKLSTFSHDASGKLRQPLAAHVLRIQFDYELSKTCKSNLALRSKGSHTRDEMRKKNTHGVVHFLQKHCSRMLGMRSFLMIKHRRIIFRGDHSELAPHAFLLK